MELHEVPYVSLVSNCTIGLIIALRIIKIKGEVITSPFSFLATANSIVWNNLKPVFVDVDPITANINPDLCLLLLDQHQQIQVLNYSKL